MRTRAAAICCLALALSLTGCGAGDNPADDTAAAAPVSVVPDLDAIASNVVRAVRVQEGDVVLINGAVRDLELLENLETEVRKQGGQPLIALYTERTARRSYDDVSEKYDSIVPEWQRIVADEVDVVIFVDGTETPDLLAHVPPARVQARNRAGQAFFTQMLKRGVRTIEVGNNMYPTHARAARFGLTRDELARYFWSGVAADPAELVQRGQQLKSVMAAGKQVRITHPNGTDLTFQLDTREVYVNDGTVTDADLKAGGANTSKYLPAGEVYARLLPNTASGKLIVPHNNFQGKDVEGLTIEVENGVITSMSAQSGGEALLAAYGNKKDGRERLSIFDIGINPAIPAAPDTRLLTYAPAGMVILYFGNDTWAGGSNEAPFAITTFLAGTTVSLDDRVLVEAGVLKL